MRQLRYKVHSEKRPQDRTGHQNLREAEKKPCIYLDQQHRKGAEAGKWSEQFPQPH